MCACEQRSNSNRDNKESTSKLSLLLLQGIREKVVVVAAYAAVDGKCLAAVWIILTKKNEEEWKGGVNSAK